MVASRAPPTGDLALHPGMCPDWESNWRTFGSQGGTQSTEPHQPGPAFYFEENISLPIFGKCHLLVWKKLFFIFSLLRVYIMNGCWVLLNDCSIILRLIIWILFFFHTIYGIQYFI